MGKDNQKKIKKELSILSKLLLYYFSSTNEPRRCDTLLTVDEAKRNLRLVIVIYLKSRMGRYFSYYQQIRVSSLRDFEMSVHHYRRLHYRFTYG